jgi:hypothetical protein
MQRFANHPEEETKSQTIEERFQENSAQSELEQF